MLSDPAPSDPGPGDPGPGDPGAADPAAIDELLAEASVLIDLDAARAEAWASGLLAETPDHEGLLDALRDALDPRSLAIATALTPMLDGATAVVAHLTAAGVEPLGYAADVGTATAVEAWSISDVHGSGTSIVIEYEHASGERHDVLVEIDGDEAVDILVSPAGVVEATSAETDTRLRVERITPAVAADRTIAALATTAARPNTPVTDAFLLNHALVVARLGRDHAGAGGSQMARHPGTAPLAAATQGREPRPADPEGDAFALATLGAVVDLDAGPPAGVEAAASGLRDAYERGDADALAVLAEIGVDGPDGVDDTALLARVVAAYVAPGPRIGLSPAAADAIDGLEWADWLGAVLQAVRAGAGTDASPEQLVRNINRCPEVTTSIPKRDAPAVASAFGCALPAWRLAGAIDDHDRLTELGVWLLPRGLATAWGRST